MSQPNDFDAWLDAELRGVPLPESLSQRLSNLARAENWDDAVDEQLQDVPVPPRLLPRLRQIPRRDMSRRVGRRMLVAAGLLLAVGIGLLELRSTGPSNHPVRDPAEATFAAIPPDATSRDEASGLESRTTGPPLLVDVVPFPRNPLEFHSVLSESGDSANLTSRSPWSDEALPQDVTPTTPTLENVYGASSPRDHMLPLEQVRWNGTLGMAPPRDAGFNLELLLRNGVQPFVFPKPKGPFESLDLPLSIETRSFQAALLAMRQGKMIDREDVRTEDFIAAMNSVVPPANPGEITLNVNGVKSFLRPDFSLLEIGASAGPQIEVPRAPVSVALVACGCFRDRECLDTLQRGLSRWYPTLGADDRVTLVASAGPAEVLLDRVRGNDTVTLASALARLTPTDDSDLVSAVQLAVNKLLVSDGVERRSLVILSAGQEVPSKEVLERLSAELTAARGQKIELTLMQVQQQCNASPFWTALGSSVGMQVKPADSPARLYPCLLEVVRHQAQEVARSVRIHVKWNPQAVDCYRLVGHEATTATGPHSATFEISLAAGQAVSDLFQVRLHRRAPPDAEVAEITVTWRGPGEDKPLLTNRATVTRKQLQVPWKQAAPSLRAAAIAYQTADWLRMPRGIAVFASWTALRRAADEELGRTSNHAELNELAQFIHWIERARSTK